MLLASQLTLSISTVLLSVQSYKADGYCEERPTRHNDCTQQNRRVEERIALDHDVANGYRREGEWHAVGEPLKEPRHRLNGPKHTWKGNCLLTELDFSEA